MAWECVINMEKWLRELLSTARERSVENSGMADLCRTLISLHGIKTLVITCHDMKNFVFTLYDIKNLCQTSSWYEELVS